VTPVLNQRTRSAVAPNSLLAQCSRSDTTNTKLLASLCRIFVSFDSRYSDIQNPTISRIARRPSGYSIAKSTKACLNGSLMMASSIVTKAAPAACTTAITDGRQCRRRPACGTAATLSRSSRTASQRWRDKYATGGPNSASSHRTSFAGHSPTRPSTPTKKTVAVRSLVSRTTSNAASKLSGSPSASGTSSLRRQSLLRLHLNEVIR